MARDISTKLIIGGDARGADAAILAMQRSGTQAASLLEREFNQLGIKSVEVFNNQRLAAERAYDRIKTSGLATANEIERAQRAHSAAMTRIDEEQFGRSESLLTKFKNNWLGAAATIGAAWATASKAISLATDGAKAQQQGTTFANLAASHGVSADKIIADLKRISGEAISTQSLIEQAGTSMLLGIDAEALPRFMEIARASSRITGESVTKSFEDISLAVGRQSRMILDNLGIIVQVEKANENYARAIGKTASELSDAEQKQAFMNATLEAGADIVERAGNLGESNAEKMAKFSAAIDNLGVSIGVLLSGPMSDLAAQTSTQVGLFDAFLNGKASLLDFADSLPFSARQSEAAERLKNLSATNLDAGVTAEGQALARKKAEEAAKKEAEAVAAAQKVAAEAQKKEREKQLEEIRKHNDRMLDIEKKRIDFSLKQETDHLAKMTSAYETAVRSMDSMIDARAAVRAQLEGRNAADSARNAPERDALNIYLDQQDEIKAAEEKIARSFGMTAEQKAKAYADLIDKAAGYNQAVLENGFEIISAFETEARYRETNERLQQQINTLLDEEGIKRATAAENFAEQMIRAEERVDVFREAMEGIETILDRMNNKEINIIFKAQNAGQIAQAAGYQNYGDYYTLNGKTYWSDGSLADSGTSYVSGSPSGWTSNVFGERAGGGPVDPYRTYLVGEKGPELLTMGSEGGTVIPNEQAGRSGNVTIAPVFHINGISASGREKTGRELAREIWPELKRLAGRDK